MPIVATSRAMGMIGRDHPAYAHEPTSIAVTSAQGQAPDLILMLGSRFAMFLVGRIRAFFLEEAKIIQVHSDAAEFGHIHQPDLVSTATIGAFADAVAWTSPAERLHGWRAALVDASHLIGSEFTVPVSDSGINPYHAANAVAEAAPDSTTFVVEGGEAGLWMAYHAAVNHPGGVCTYGQLGALGIGMGFAIGAAHARPGHPVIQVTGDGAIGFYLQAFELMVRQRLPIIAVVLNNNAWGMSIHGQQILYGENYSAISVLGDVRYHEIAKAFGCYGERVERLEDIGPAIGRAVASGLPGCIDVTVDLDVVAPGTSAMLGDGSPTEIMVPYYENTPLD